MMQSPSSIQDFPHAPPNQPSRRRFDDIEAELISAHLQQQQRQQQEPAIHDNQPSNNEQKPGFATSFLYKLTELAAYTSAVAAEAYQTITGPPEKQQSSPHHHKYPEYYGDVMQIKATGEEDNEMMGVDSKRNVWDAVNNVDEEEPPPPYDNSWRMVIGKSERKKCGRDYGRECMQNLRNWV